MVDAALAECGAAQQRLRKLPARVVVYLLLAGALFEECGYPAVWARLTAALGSLPVPKITATGLWHARARLGVRPMRALFNLLRGPASAIRTTGARRAGLLVVAVDGTYLDVPDAPATRARLGKGSNQYSASGYPQICVVALVCCGTRAVIDAVFGPRTSGETTHGKRLARSVNPGMIVLLDRGFSSNAFLATVAETRAAFLARLSATRKPPVLRRYDDGSFLSRIGQLEVRIIECEITIATTAGRTTGVYRLATTPARPPPLSGIRAGQALSRAVGSGIRLLRDQEIHAWQARPARPDHGGHRPGGLRPAHRLPTDQDRHRRRHPGRPRHRPRPRQLQHRPPDRTRPSRPSHRRTRRHRHRPRRHHRTSSPQPTHARPPPTRQPPRHQTPTIPIRIQRACASTDTPTPPPSASTSSRQRRSAPNFTALLCPERERKKHVGTLLVAMLYEG